MDVPGSEWLGDGKPFLIEQRTLWRNSSGSWLSLSAHGKLLLEVLMVLMCIGAVMGNILVIMIVVATKAFHSVTSVLIINLAISDFLVGIGVMPFVALSVMNNGWVNCNDLCLYVGYTSSVYCTASVLTLAAIALDRYYSIVDCLHYESRCTVWRSGAVVLWIWLQAMLTSSPPLLGWSNVSFVRPMYSCAVNWASSPSYTVFMALFSFFLPALIILFCYLKIVRVARHHARRIHNIQQQLHQSRAHPSTAPLESVQQSLTMNSERQDLSELVYYVSGRFVSEDDAEMAVESTSHHGGERSSKLFKWYQHTFRTQLQNSRTQPDRDYRHHGIVRLFMVIAAFFLCWTPYITVALVQATETAISQSTSQVPPVAVTISYWLVLFNSDINPLLYAILSKRFQGAMQNLKKKIQTKFLIGVNLREERPIRETRGFTNSTNILASMVEQSPRDEPQQGLAYSSVFKANSAFSNTFKEDLNEVLLPGGVLPSSSHHDLWPSCSIISQETSDCLQVSPKPQEQDKLHISSGVTDRPAKFFYGQITVRVEHDVC